MMTDAHRDHDVTLGGCAPEPLLAYLKGLGILRLVAAQSDGTARGYWRDDTFHLVSALDADALEQFFLDAYRPTPIISPWNSASGFTGDVTSTPRAIVRQFAQSIDPRLAVFRQTIEASQRIVDAARANADDKEGKADILRRCRNELPDEALLWLDAAVVLTGDGPRFPPLLGSGGNDGRLEFSVNYMYRLADVLPGLFNASQESPKKRRADPQDHLRSHDWLHAALFGGPYAPQAGKAVGQFNPGGVGGPNASMGFEADSLVNPWDLVLALEGTIFFATATARRFTTGSGTVAASPFTVRPSAVGYASAGANDEGSSKRGELWVPLWDRPTGSPELAYLFGEGRAAVGRRRAVTGVDFARAVASLGVDRGVSTFVRYGFLQRSGKAYLASPLGRLQAGAAPVESIDLIAEVDGLLEAWRRVADTGKVGSHAAAVRYVEQVIFDLAARHGSDERRSLLAVLVALGRAERTFAEFAAAQRQRGESVQFRPLQGLSTAWLTRCEETVELRLAAALASLGHGSPLGPLRQNLEHVRDANGRWAWADQKDTAVVWGGGALPINLARVLERRCLDARRHEVTPLPLDGRRVVGLFDVDAFLHGAVDEPLVADLTWALCGLKDMPSAPTWRDEKRSATIPRVYALLKLLFWPGQVRDVVVRDEPSLLPLLRAGRVAEAVAVATRRLRASGLTPSGDDYMVSPQVGGRLAATLLIPISSGALTHCTRLVLTAPTPTL